VNKALGPEMKSTGESILLMTWKTINFMSCTLEEKCTWANKLKLGI
jgi:hypothetical protein